MNRVDLEGRTFELRNDNARARRFREECALDGDLLVTVIRVIPYHPRYRGGKVDVLTLIDTSAWKFSGNSLSFDEISEREIWREVA